MAGCAARPRHCFIFGSLTGHLEVSHMLLNLHKLKPVWTLESCGNMHEAYCRLAFSISHSY